MRGEAFWGSTTLCPASNYSPSPLAFLSTIKGNGTAPGWGWGRGLGWAVALELSGVMEASCFAVEGARAQGTFLLL